MRKRTILARFGVLLVAVFGVSSKAAAFRVLVTNDDGFDAPGLSVLVEALDANPALEVAVIAPETNQSGTGDQFTNGPIDIRADVTQAGFPALAVTGRPADTVLFGILKQLPERPDVVVSGINLGQNIAELVNISGTVGAGLSAARLGVPAIAVSQALVPGSYDEAAAYAANLVERLRTRKTFRSRMTSTDGSGRALVLNVNFPSCGVGITRGVRVVPLGRARQVVDYTLTMDDGTIRTYAPSIENVSAFAIDCTSTLVDPRSDLEALTNGFASVTPLNPDLTVNGRVDRFGFLERIDF
ncbi:MAG: 5'/3'-nucleotidase SurE [Deltaproteobacteria bacterium]|nr:MAG: 5'/3'-nucleotidase SurE [Deltaproteobacteria bacterium]